MTTDEREHMTLVPYAFVVRSLMYIMVCTRPDVVHAMRIVDKPRERILVSCEVAFEVSKRYL